MKPLDLCQKIECEGCGAVETVERQYADRGSFSRWWYRLPEGWVCVWAWRMVSHACSEACARRALEIL